MPEFVLVYSLLRRQSNIAWNSNWNLIRNDNKFQISKPKNHAYWTTRLALILKWQHRIGIWTYSRGCLEIEKPSIRRVDNCNQNWFRQYTGWHQSKWKVVWTSMMIVTYYQYMRFGLFQGYQNYNPHFDTLYNSPMLTFNQKFIYGNPLFCFAWLTRSYCKRWSYKHKYKQVLYRQWIGYQAEVFHRQVGTKHRETS